MIAIEHLADLEPQRVREGVVALIGQRGDAAEVADFAKTLTLTDVNRALLVADAVIGAADATDWRGRARGLVARAHALCYLNRVEEALSAIGQAQALASREGDSREFAHAALTLVQPLALAGRLGDAEHYAASAAEAYAEAGLSVEAAKAAVNRAIVQRMQGRAREALATFEQARPALRADPIHRAVLDSNRAEALLDLEEFDRAADAFGAAIDAFEHAGNRHAAAIVEGNIAHLYGRQGRMHDALRHFERARRRFEDCGATADWARLQAEEAETLASIGALHESAARFGEAVTQLDQAGLPREAAFAQFGAALALIRLQRDAAAEQALLEARRRFEILQIPPALAQLDAAEAALLERSGKLAEAEQRLRLAIESLAATPVSAAQLRVRLAGLLLRRGALDGCDDLLRHAATVLDAHALPLQAAALHASRGRLLARRAQRAAALAEFERAIEAVERARVMLPSERLRATWLAAGSDIFLEAASVALDLADADGMAFAYLALERLRARSLLELFDAPTLDPSPRPADDDRLAHEFDQLRARLHAAYQRLGLGVGESHSPSELAAQQARVARLERDLLALEARLAATARLAPVFSRPASLDEARRRLPDQLAVLKYFAEADAMSAMVVRRDGSAVHRRICSLAQLAILTRRYEFQMQRAIARGPRLGACDPGPARSAAQSLHDCLLAPLAADLERCTRVAIVPYGALHGLPLHALEGQAPPLLERADVVYCPSLSTGLALGQRRAEDDCSLDLLAIGVGHPLAPRMVHEAQQLAGNHARRAALAAERATTANFRAAAATARCVHLAVHCVFDPAFTLGARLQLADGWLAVRDIASLRLRGSAIILAGCETGRTAGDTGEERFGLLRAFLAAGARLVIGSLWPISDEHAQVFFERLYEGLPPGADLAPQHLRQAQLAQRAAGVHPAFWAGLFCYGGIQ